MPSVWHRGCKVTLVPAHFRLHPHLACRLPYRFPRGRFTPLPRVRVPAPWLPYRFPRGRLGVGGQHFGNSRGFPTDFPVVGCERPNVLESRIIARELRERAAPIEPCGTRLDIVRIAGFDMAGDLLQVVDRSSEEATASQRPRHRARQQARPHCLERPGSWANLRG